ncbi:MULTISPECIES: sulfite exporter TauE/SafE family protein [Glycomyces]|uniref:Probable membrane transporter protein n=2 Tax=Glycomyces TaxID=58113 RepID=A0A9X3SV22_9ACTN|nr:sulfite exporter TauE/SafE family protein [Glycomyces lechevalierae]MDA1385544.1 sulfite exporter TauE/SafE family protein [Glycomyces lechevalierae]MDR7339620.1 putative membrane protein YfcA [Glycomyces lechevalierae]
MGWLEAAAILAAGFGAGMINVIVGSGTLISFPVLLLFGYPPVVANVSNTLGLVPGSLSGTIGYRRELQANGRLARMLVPASMAGGILGASLLFLLPAAAFELIVPVLIAVGIAMVLVGPLVQRNAARRAAGRTGPSGTPLWKTAVTLAGMFALGVYGGYFGAAQGILIVGLLSLLTVETLQSLNGVKNLLVMAVNLIAAVAFLVISPASIDWLVVALIAVGSALGGLVGARIGRRLPAPVLRGAIAAIGTVAIVYLLAT